MWLKPNFLSPYWAQRLGENKLQARQISSRGGDLLCELRGGRVFMSGNGHLASLSLVQDFKLAKQVCMPRSASWQ